MKTISTEIMKSIELIIDKKLKELPFDRTYDGKITKVNSDGYTVSFLGRTKDIKTKATNVLNVNDSVLICSPHGSEKDAYIVVDLDIMKKLLG